MDKTCEWKHDGDGDDGNDWVTECHRYFEFTDEGPKENGFEFCPYCGGRLVIQNEADS